jgi:hypothetical protein
MTFDKRNSIFVSSQEYFKEVVEDALTNRKVKTHPLAEHYLVQLLEGYMTTDRLFEEENGQGQKNRETLAEMFLKAVNDTHGINVELLKKLGDSSLYISGFFGDSLSRKIVDIDYYAEMGGNAYNTLAAHTREESFRQIYSELAYKFQEFVDVLTYISNKTLIQSNESLLRLYERYLKTGSDLAREQLLEKGLITLPRDGQGKYEQ